MQQSIVQGIMELTLIFIAYFLTPFFFHNERKKKDLMINNFHFLCLLTFVRFSSKAWQESLLYDTNRTITSLKLHRINNYVQFSPWFPQRFPQKLHYLVPDSKIFSKFPTTLKRVRVRQDFISTYCYSTMGKIFSFCHVMEKHIMEPAARRCRSIHSDGE